jgi:multidrug/hemolysin transport system permease protein
MTLALIERNLKLYLRDRMGVFFSFLSVFLVLLLYALFLGDNTVSNVQDSIGRDIPGIDELVNTWLLAGIVMISTVTVPISALAVFMEDKDRHLIDDFYTAPIKRSRLALSYLLSSVIIASVMTMVNFFLGQGYMLFLGYDLLPIGAMLEILGLIVVSSFSFSSFFFVLTFLFTTSRSFGSLGTIVGTLVGFFGGIYVPVGVLASGVVTVMNFVPVAHAVTLFRQAYTSVTLPLVFDGAPVDVVRDFSLFFGLDIQYGSYVMPSFLIFFVLIGYGLLFFSLSTFLLTKQKRA